MEENEDDEDDDDDDQENQIETLFICFLFLFLYIIFFPPIFAQTTHVFTFLPFVLVFFHSSYIIYLYCMITITIYYS